MKHFNRLLPHINMIAAVMLMTFVIIDYFNSAMHFINNNITKGLIAFFAITAFWASILLIIYQRKDPK